MKELIMDGFTCQPEDSHTSSGLYALKHALLLLGIPSTNDEVGKAVGVTSMSVTREQMLQGIRHFHCIPIERICEDPQQFQGELNQLLAKGIPAIVPVLGGKSFVTISGKHSNDEYYWIDAAAMDPFRCGHIAGLLRFMESDEYLLLGVIPPTHEQLCYSLIPNFRSLYELLTSDRLLRERWGRYLHDLLYAFGDSPGDVRSVLPANEFFDTYGKMLVEATCHHVSAEEEKEVEWELACYHRVAEAHYLGVPKEQLVRALVEVAAALVATACIEG